MQVSACVYSRSCVRSVCWSLQVCTFQADGRGIQGCVDSRLQDSQGLSCSGTRLLAPSCAFSELHAPQDRWQQLFPRCPCSEPEVQVLLALATELKPHVWLNVHSGMYALFTPYDHKGHVPNTTGGLVRQCEARPLRHVSSCMFESAQVRCCPAGHMSLMGCRLASVLCCAVI
jgi:hypothetical protein